VAKGGRIAVFVPARPLATAFRGNWGICVNEQEGAATPLVFFFRPLSGQWFFKFRKGLSRGRQNIQPAHVGVGRAN